jgi:hypothetical protein
MSAVKTLKMAQAAGVRIDVEGRDLVLAAAAPPPPALLRILARDKAEILRLLRPANDVWTPADWQALFDERAAIAEFDGGLSRPEAEAQAFTRCATHWLERQGDRLQLTYDDAVQMLRDMGVGLRVAAAPHQAGPT